MAFTQLDHIGFTVADLDRSVEWYTFFLGIEPRFRGRWDVGYIGELVGYPECRMECAYWDLPGGGTLELIQYLAPTAGTVDMETYNIGNGHMCLYTDDLRGEYERLRGRAEFRSPEPVAIPYGPYEGGLVCYLRDPDGISIQLMQPPADEGGARGTA